MRDKWRSSVCTPAVLRDAAAGAGGVVASQGFQLAAEGGTGQGIQEHLDCGESEVRATDCEVVAFAGEREEIESEYAGGGARSDAAVGLAGANLPGSGE